MQKGTMPTGGKWRIVVILGVLLLAVPLSVWADPLPNETGQTATPVPTFPPDSAPRVVLTSVTIEKFSCTVNGTAIPGIVNGTITTVIWDWGDNTTSEYHEFPYSHNYGANGTYTLTVTAVQSDGQIADESETIVIAQPEATVTTASPTPGPTPFPPGGPGPEASPPALILLEPVIDGTNVTINGNINPGGPGESITALTVNWSDGNLTTYKDFPAAHTYSETGIYTINITGTQSDGQSTTKGITIEITGTVSGPPGEPSGQVPPPVGQPPYLLALTGLVIVVLLGVIVQQIYHRRQIPDIPKSVSEEEDRYYRAKEKGDMATAAETARSCSRMFRDLADRSPARHLFYLEMAESWENKAIIATRSIYADSYQATKPAAVPENLPSREDLNRICEGTDVTPEVIDAVIRVAWEIAREGREGRAVGTSFVVGDADTVMKKSRQFVLNPFHGHKDTDRQITDTAISGNIKEFAQLDGSFVVTGDGIVESAGRYITIDMSQVQVPEGLGSRHSSIAGITLVSKSIGIVVSQSGGMISVFKDGRIVYTIGG